MATDKSNNPSVVLDRILRERLDQYEVPAEVRAELRKEILAFMERPERTPYGACVMTPEASQAADRAREAGRNSPDDPKPRIV